MCTAGDRDAVVNAMHRQDLRQKPKLVDKEDVGTRKRKWDGYEAGSAPRRVAVSWSGGKDSNLTLHRMVSDPTNAVVALVVFHPPQPSFRAHPIHMMELQAQALGLPLLRMTIRANNFEGNYRKAYAACIQELRNEHNIEAIATGDMDLVGDMTRNFVEECCEIAQCDPPMECLLPLWKADRDEVLRGLLDLRIRCRYTCVKAPWFDESWIGRELDKAAVAEMEKISVDDAAKKLDMCGENGEYHTCAIDGPLYKAVIVWDDLAQDTWEEITGAEGQGSRWWVLKDLDAIGPCLHWK